MKTSAIFVLLLIALNTLSQDSFYKFQWYGTIGQGLPLGAFSADSRSSNALETGKSRPFGQSFRIGFDFYPVKHLGITAGSAILYFSRDQKIFENMHHFDPGLTESYFHNSFESNRVQVGLTSRVTINRFSAEPKIAIGVVTAMRADADVYFKSTSGEIYRTISYSFSTTTNSEGVWPCFNGAINLNYNVFQKEDGLALGLLFFSEFTYYKPKVERETTASDSHTDIITHSMTIVRQPFFYYYYGFGIILKYGWFTEG